MSVERRRKWELHYRDYVLVEQFAFSDLLFHIIGLGPRFLCRSYLLRRRSTIMPDGGYLITQHTESHPSYPDDGAGLPQRATVFFQGTRIRQLPLPFAPSEANHNAFFDLAEVAHIKDSKAPLPAPQGEGVLVEVLSIQDSKSRLPYAVQAYACAREPWKWAHALYHDIVAHTPNSGAPARPAGTDAAAADGSAVAGNVATAAAGDAAASGDSAGAGGWRPMSPLLQPIAAVTRGVAWGASAVGNAVWGTPDKHGAAEARVREMYDGSGQRENVSKMAPM